MGTVQFGWILKAFFMVSALSISCTAAGQSGALPNAIRIVVPFTPGGSNDVFGRALAEQLSRKLGITVLVENKPGAGGMIGSAEVARAKPDGATLLLSSNSFVTRAATDDKLAFDSRTAFTPVAMVAQGGMLLVVSNETTYQTVADLIADSKRRPINFGSAGVGSIGHLSGELFTKIAEVDLTHVPYKGISPAMTDMIGGRLFSMITTSASLGGAIKGRQVRPLAVTSLTPSKFFPDLPTVAQTVPGYSVNVWWGVYAPANTPTALVDRLNQAIRDVSAQPRLMDLFAAEAAEPSDMSAKQFSTYVNEELDKWQQLARERGIKQID